MNNKEFQELIAKYLRGECNEAETVLVEQWYSQYNEDEMAPGAEEIEAARLHVLQQLPQAAIVKKLNRPFPTFRVAVAFSLFIGCFIGFNHFSSNKNNQNVYANTIIHGSNKAVFTFANGQSYQIEDTLAVSKEGKVAKERAIHVVKAENGQLEIISRPGIVLTPIRRDSIHGLVKLKSPIGTPKINDGFNTVSTPTGGQFRVVLPDGTRVDLNAGSVLRFPNTFEGLSERMVYFSGEAYFHVSSVKSVLGMKKRAAKMPFIVVTADQEVRVMSTKFNINSYDYGNAIKTTLVDGLVEVSTSKERVTIKPGMAAFTQNLEVKAVQKDEVDLDQDIAWVNGDFVFSTQNLGTIMVKVARWYDLKIVFTDQNMMNKPFSGAISKYATIQQLLRILERTGEIKFKVDYLTRIVTISK